MPRKKLKIGLVDADLLCNGTRHPNLILMKLAGFLNDNDIDFKLIIDQGLDERMLAESPHGEEMAEMLTRTKHHGDFIYRN